MKPTSLLIVDDDEMNREILSRRLRRHGYAITAAADGRAALAAVAADDFDLVLLDVEMPGMNGLQVLRHLRERHGAADLPVIMVSGYSGTDAVVSALNSGANDYVTKPFDFDVIRARIDAQLVRRQRDAVRQRTDVLTGLANRLALADWWNARSAAGCTGALALNLDRFRAVNNGLGRSYGDRVLVEVATRLTLLAPDRALIVRLDGDTFACLLQDTTPDSAGALASAIVAAMRLPFDLGDRQITLPASVGLAVDHAPTVDDLLSQADSALYRAKALSGDRWEMFDPAVQSRAAARLQLELELQHALATSAFTLRYQPIVDLKTGAVVRFEALVRWIHPGRGEIGPADFIPVAEETGLIEPLGACVLQQACRQLREWQSAVGTSTPFSVAVNISAAQLRHEAFVEVVQRILTDTAIDATWLQIEITESTLMDNTEQVRRVLQRLLSLGVRISLDDFGTGYSSLSYLQHFSIDTLKIDHTFVRALGRPNGNAEIVRAIVQLADKLQMDVVAEGIETTGELQALQALGCGYGQGFLFAHPLEPARALDFVRRAGVSSFSA